MVTWNNWKYMYPGCYYYEGDCWSGDDKPLSIPGKEIFNGSVLLEDDTGIIWKYNQAANKWVIWGSNSGDEQQSEG